MAKCTKCGRHGLFLKLQDGLCSNCIANLHVQYEAQQLEERCRDAQQRLEALNTQLANGEALYSQIASKAEADGAARAKQNLSETIEQLKIAEESLTRAKQEEEKAAKSAASAVRKVERSRTLIKAIENAISRYNALDSSEAEPLKSLITEAETLLSPTVVLDLQCLNVSSLRKRFRQNEKLIEQTLEKYRGRYTTKANATIYNLMVIALRAELQNVLYSINLGKIEDALKSIEKITAKYYEIAVSGNQSIAPTMKKFIGEIEYYFQEAVKIEYEYYVQKERAKEEQRAIREQMRQEAEDRRALEAEKKKIEKEESKFHDQIASLQEQMQGTMDAEKTAQLEARIAELQSQLEAVQVKKEEITTLQNGKAGNVYVISNLGAFGDDVFKIGMTRRLEPQERIDELGSASVPFPFDVHSFIFSDDAVALENKIHKILNERRVNKVNLRKEFFRVSLDELESLVAELAPTAEFRRTMLAEQFHQSLSISHVVDVPDEGDISGKDDDDDISNQAVS